MGVLQGDTRSSDYSSYWVNPHPNTLKPLGIAYSAAVSQGDSHCLKETDRSMVYSNIARCLQGLPSPKLTWKPI